MNMCTFGKGIISYQQGEEKTATLKVTDKMV